MIKSIIAVSTLLISFSLSAQEITGDWEGKLKVQGIELRLIFHIDQNGDRYTATMDSPDQGVNGITVDEVTFEAGRLYLKIDQIKAEFKGEVEEEKAAIEGKFIQLGTSFPLLLTRPEGDAEEEIRVKSENAAEVAGAWHGVLEIMGSQLPIIFHIVNDNDVLSATMDSPNQGAKDIPVQEVWLKNGQLVLKIPAFQITFTGTPDNGFTRIEGVFQQVGRSTPLLLSRETVKSVQPQRPQEPARPYPYREEEVQFENRMAGLTLAGTLTLPESGGPHPVVVLISGSGPQNRDEELLGHRPFLVLSDHLTRRGVGVLRFDDRGVGESSGDFSTATSADFATDVSAAIDYLKTRPEVRKEQIGLIGHSEGGLIAPMVAVQSKDDVAFIVLLAGPGVDGSQILRLQSRLIAEAEGTEPAKTKRNLATLERVIAVLKSETDVKKAEEEIKKLLANAYEEFTAAEKKEVGEKEAFIEGHVAQMITPWMRYFLTYDPQPTLARVKCPVLAINGSLDLQVPSQINLGAIREALAAGGNERVTIRELAGLNHLFQQTETGAVSEYGKLEETISPVALELISDWILETVNKVD